MGFCRPAPRHASVRIALVPHTRRDAHEKINPSHTSGWNERSEQQVSFCARPGAGRGRCRHGGRRGNGHARPVGCHSHGLRASRRWVGVNKWGRIFFSFFSCLLSFCVACAWVLPKVEHCRLHGDNENSMYMSFCVFIIYLFLSPCFVFLSCVIMTQMYMFYEGSYSGQCDRICWHVRFSLAVSSF